MLWCKALVCHGVSFLMLWCKVLVHHGAIFFLCYGPKFLFIKVQNFCILWFDVLLYSGDMAQSSCTSWGKVLVLCSAKFLHVIVKSSYMLWCEVLVSLV